MTPSDFEQLCMRLAEENKEFIQSIKRIGWNQYFLNLAFVVSLRSIDAQTKHGTILIDSNKRILSTGYNSHPQRTSPEILPNIRPNKYKVMVHSEANAIASMRSGPWSIPNGIIAYITGRPCLSCLGLLINSNIKCIFAANRPGWHGENGDQDYFDYLIGASGISYNILEPDFSYIEKLVT